MSPDDAQIAELAAFLPAEETPVKLRCATCSQIAYNAFKLPCCEQNICETCHNDLEDICQVCHHEPLDKSLCIVARSLRVTTKVFLKKKLLERAKEQKKKKDGEASNAALEASAAIVESTETLTDKDSIYLAADEDTVGLARNISENDTSVKLEANAAPQPEAAETVARDEGFQEVSLAVGMDVPQQSIEISKEDSKAFDEAHVGDNASIVPQTQALKDGQDNAAIADGQLANGGMMPNLMNGAGLNGITGAFPIDFNQMIPNGMQMPTAGFSNVMGMGMDPNMMNQMSQPMLGGFGGPNMGINGMGMGFNGQGQFGGPWMGQDAFNANGHGNGNFGVQVGYNMPHQGNFNQMNHQQYSQNDFSNGYGRHGFQNRGGRGRRGGFYNGGYNRTYTGQINQGNQNGYANQNQHTYPTQVYQQQLQPAGSSGPSTAYTVSAKTQGHDEIASEAEEARMMKELAPGGDEDNTIPTKAAESGQVDATIGHAAEIHEDPGAKSVESFKENAKDGGVTNGVTGEDKPDTRQETRLNNAEDHNSQPLPIQTFMSEEPSYGRSMPPPGPNAPLGPSGRGFARGFQHSTNGVQLNHPIMKMPIISGTGVVGAPTGPRALREGLPNSARSVHTSVQKTKAASSIVSGNGRDHTKSRSPSRQRSRTHSPKSPGRERSEIGHRDRQRTRSRSPADKPEREKVKEYRRPRHYDEKDRPEDESLPRRSSHRSRRHHEKECDPSGHRRHRDRSHERDREKDKAKRGDRDRDQERTREREDDEPREGRRHRRRRSRTPLNDSNAPTPASTHASELLNGVDSGPRKRHIRVDELDRDAEAGYDRRERKRSRRDRSPSLDRHAHHQASSCDNSKPATPLTPSIESLLRRSSNPQTGVPSAPRAPATKSIPTGPRSSQHVSNSSRDHEYEREEKRDRARERASARSNATRLSHDNGTSAAETGVPEKDPHTLEREARDRERLLKEMQRRATMDGPKKKASGHVSRGGRKISVKYEDEGGIEARRVEIEREGARWH